MRYVEQPHPEVATVPYFRYRAPIGASWPSRDAKTSAGGRRRIRTAQPSLLATRATGPVGAAHGMYLVPPGRSPQHRATAVAPSPSGHDAALLAGAPQLWCLQILALVTAARSDGVADRSLVFDPPSRPTTAQTCVLEPSLVSQTHFSYACLRARMLCVCSSPGRVPSLPNRATRRGRHGQAEFHDEMACLLPTPTPRGCARAVGHRLRLVSAACISLTGRAAHWPRARERCRHGESPQTAWRHARLGLSTR